MVNFPNERVKLKIPINGINEVGQAEAHNLLAEWNMPILPDDFAWVWKVGGKGEYVGTFPKRVAKWLYQKHGIKLSAQQLSIIGNKVSAHCERNIQYTFDFTSSLDWDAGDFGDDGSCFWSCRAGARDMLEENGGKAVRFYTDDGRGYARAWLAPVDNGWIVFNGYGLESLQIARILSHYWGAYYKKARLVNNGETCGVLWVNRGQGYIIANQSDCKDSYDLGWDDVRTGGDCCYYCDEYIEAGDGYGFGGDTYCEGCYNEMFFFCNDCDGDCHNDDHNMVGDDSVCDDCLDAYYSRCVNCDEYHRDTTKGPDSEERCASCHSEHVNECEDCAGDHMIADSYRGSDNVYRCEDCHDKIHSTCFRCGAVCHNDDIKTGPDGELRCEDCYDTVVSTCCSCGDEDMNDNLKMDAAGHLYCSHCDKYEDKLCGWCSDPILLTEGVVGHHADCAEYVAA